MNREDRFSPPVTGGISLLVAFAVLCLTVFALLGLTTVQAQSRLNDASLKAVTDYYGADCEAMETLALLRKGEKPAGVVWKDDIYSYSCPISETQVLEVEVRMDGEDYSILRWQAVPKGQENGDEDTGLELWDGGGLF